VDTLGYPVSQPYVRDGFTYQAFQRGVLQWRPEMNAALLSNTFDWLTTADRDEWLGTLGIPAPLQDSSNGDWNRALNERLAWLTNEPIKNRFMTNPTTGRPWTLAEAVNLYGVPQSRPEQRGPFIVQRFQRIAFQLWTESVPSMPARGSVVGVLGGDLVKTAQIVPASATSPDNGNPQGPITISPAPTSTPTPTATPAPTATPTRTPTPGPTATPRVTATPVPPPASTDLAVVARYAFDRMNAFRVQGGRAALAWNDAIARAAQAHAESQARALNCSHTGTDGSTIMDRLARVGITPNRRGENISCGAAFGRGARDEVDAALANFMAEPYSIFNHHGNIMNPEHRRAGVGIAPRGDGRGFFFVTNFTD
jgi:uncharacterized protein YkwD